MHHIHLWCASHFTWCIQGRTPQVHVFHQSNIVIFEERDKVGSSRGGPNVYTPETGSTATFALTLTDNLWAFA
ncbi:hypothetical protein SERLA73DRAFT_175636 [Serpula lacrymans var. lacrymans S7.3]|uniref:Uncharacterized protein n=2 Tax=Serpula lacrymans var. lacrymans TaxID=341189 RepID=F8PL30_SERL3|nr:uncharacterized protein SERLADRAFT_458185 [Serpula lacrymans var. lacrymans S7.9]EGO03938.1 hypothetical protein SERLA73DRAFT_175636 [Serpula lacrymans var. lacrymans S7.3]EGO29859.1 hypothetical protein SERLADRAFT_458185 [Serpula lacrymans var. lacrymans S7.9]